MSYDDRAPFDKIEGGTNNHWYKETIINHNLPNWLVC